jgi:hypothetical protein
MSVFFPAGTFYEDFDMNFDVKDEILYLHDETTPFTQFYYHRDNKYTVVKRKSIYSRY